MIKSLKKLLFCCFLLFSAGILLLFYAVKVEPYISVLRSHTLGDSSSSIQLKLVQISDVQISANYTVENFKKIVKKIKKLQPDILVFTGDLYENYAAYHDDDSLISVLSEIETTYGKYAIWGNRDYGGGFVRQYEAVLKGSSFRLLENEGKSIHLDNGKTLFLAGLDDYLLGDPDITPVLGQLNSSEYQILMLHEPDTADFYKELGFDLILAGHSHGGQVHIPFFPKKSTSMAEKYIQGFYDLGISASTVLYVNSGIGTSRYPIRFLEPPEITQFQIGIT